MNHKLATLAILGLATCALAACSNSTIKTSETPKEPAKPMLSEAAQQALAQAEADVNTVKAKFALWTTAESALSAAEAAAKNGDSAVVLKQAKFVSDQVALGIAQLSYPSTEPK